MRDRQSYDELRESFRGEIADEDWALLFGPLPPDILDVTGDIARGG